MQVLRSCEECGPIPWLANSSVEVDARSDITIAYSSSCCSLPWAKVEATSDGSSAAILVEVTVEQSALVLQL